MQTILASFILYFLLFFSPFVWAMEPSGAPILRIETGMHTGVIRQISVDAQERFLLTASNDKTLRLWDLKTGDLLKTYRVPIGDNPEGMLYAGAISPDGQLVVGGGWTGYEWEQSDSVYLFNRVTGKLIKRLYGLRYVISHLCFSPDGQYLAASLGNRGTRIWETQNWEQVFADTDYGAQSLYCVFDTQNRLLTSARDGYLRLYSLNNNNFILTMQKKVPGVTKPSPYQRYPEGVAFSPSGDKIVAGFYNSKSVFVFDGNSLEFLFQVDTKDIPLSMRNIAVAWSPDGQRLCAGGSYHDHDGKYTFLIRCWLEGGQGDHMDWSVSNDAITALYFLKNGELIYGTQDPMWGILDQTGHIRLWKSSPIVDYRNTKENHVPLLLVSQEGAIVQFHLEPGENRPARFSLMEQQLVLNPAPDNALLPPDQTSLNITDWDHPSSHTLPKLNGTTLSFPLIGTLTSEIYSTSLAISPDQSNFLLGSDCCLRLFDTQGQQLWGVILPSSASAWALNISGDGQKAIAALEDGTIRWYNLSDGEELLAFFPHKDGQNWVAWTPSGYYMSSGKDVENSLLGWHVNHGLDQEASFYPIGELYSKIYNRPEVVQKTLIDLSEDEALWELDTENFPNEPSSTPMLRVETGMHTARINRFDIDATEQFLVTASHDKTLRLWELETGKLLTVYRVPIGENNEGFLYSTALSPDSQWIATAGETGKTWENDYLIYLFDRTTGQLTKRLMGLPSSVAYLCFSPDGQYLAASLYQGGIRIWETQTWTQIFNDTQYEQSSQFCQFDSDNRLLTSSDDGYLRLYSATGNEHFSLVKHIQAPGGKQPFHAVFSPKGDKIAVGFDNSTQINVLDGQTLELLYVPNTSGVNGSLFSVAWSFDEQRICAGGHHRDNQGNQLIRCWSQGGRGDYADWIASSNTILQLRFLKNGNLVYSSAFPSWGLLDNVGQKRQEHIAPIADYRSIRLDGSDQARKILWISYKGNIVQFSFDFGERPAQFSLSSQHLYLYPPPDSSLQLADTSSLNITDWQGYLQPKLNGTVLPFFEFNENDRSFSLAIAPDRSWFILGTERALRVFWATGEDSGEYLGDIPLPGTPWAINFSGDGQKVIAALGDGTIRWYSSSFKELLTFFPHIDGKRWIAWTPSGYYMSSGEDAESLLGWHVNQGKDKAALFYPISALQTEFKRPDIVKKVLDTLSEEKAILVANLEKRIDVGEPMTQRQRLELAKEKYQVNVTPSGLGKAVIVAASGEQSDNLLFPYTNKATQAMYNLLHDRGFSDGDILYLNPFPPVVPPNGYVEIRRQDFPMRNPLTELSQAITQAAGELKSGQQFIFYLHGHAREQAIQLSPMVELSAQRLKELLAQMPQDVPQIIILDTCYSGSFLPELSGVPHRIVITSADSESKAWSNEVKSFAEKFIRQLKGGNSLYSAFTSTEQMMVDDPKIFASQHPQLDDNQDGRYLKDEEGQVAKTIFLGNQKVSASSPPTITEVHPAIYLDPSETTATLWVKTSVDMNDVNKVEAILTNEHDQPTEYQGTETEFSRRAITLTANHETQRFETEYSGFQAAQQWRIFYQVETVEGQWSDFAEGYVRRDQGSSAVTLETKMNQLSYQSGDPFQFEVMIFGEGNFDLYVGLVFPDGSYYTISSPFQWSAQNELNPYQQNLQVNGSQTLTVFSLISGVFPAWLFPGEYQACGLLTQAQSDPNEMTHWVKLDCQVFRF